MCATQHGGIPEAVEHGVSGFHCDQVRDYVDAIHAVGALRTYRARPNIDLDSFGLASRDYLLAAGLIHT
mgnify:CR=1 FL=1